jgi:hypothetical protein
VAWRIDDCISIIKIYFKELAKAPLPCLLTKKYQGGHNLIAFRAECPCSNRLIIQRRRCRVKVFLLFLKVGCRDGIIHALNGYIYHAVIVDE